ncbi:MAG: c-type cytochrome [Flavobacteriales bacterium]|nr:c-type cytochrome [Flavobacteriales bacterium]
MNWRTTILLGPCLVLLGCRKDIGPDAPLVDTPYELDVPNGFPEPPLRGDNPLTVASVALGKALFFERRLSRNGTISCGSCHIPSSAFSDTVALSLGVDHLPGLRNSPPLTNLAYHTSFFKDGGVPDLELQVLAPIHDELEMDHDILAAAAVLSDEQPYRTLSQRAYGRELDAFVITRAIANYERTLLSGWSRYDRYLQGDGDALSSAEVNGMNLFFSPEVACGECHSGHDLSDHSFQNVGQYLEYEDPGRQRITLSEADAGKFKVPTLRNVTLTAPYMHDGSMADLGEVVDHFLSGGLPHPNRSVLMQEVQLTTEERSDLIAFLAALEDEGPIDRTP